MRFRSKTHLAICVALSVQANAQFSNWQKQQVNTSICIWSQPRAALIRDTVYLDGGTIWWSPGMASGEQGQPVNEGNYQGNILAYNLSEPFSKHTNVTGLLLKNLMSKARGGTVNGISTEPNYSDGGMLANDAEFFLYGGAVFKNLELYDLPASNAVLGYRQYAYGPEKPLWQKGFSGGHLDDGVNRYIAYGGATSAPSENKAWYFSGLTSPTKGEILANGDNATRAMNVSNTLIELDMAAQLDEKWSNITLPDKIKGRANPEVVWVPVGKQGILVVLGGVTHPEWATEISKSDNETDSKLKSPEFMRIIDIYDIANKTWYQQPTEGGPGARTRGCAVVATAADKSSFNIYYYGGFDGIHPKGDFYDDVWALSLPSFTWTLITKGIPSHGRSGHKCFTPYPDQMMVFGGYTSLKGFSLNCLDQGPVIVFNLTSGIWMDGYSPTKHADYGVHEKITTSIGGTASGGATATTPLPLGWSSSDLGNVFSVAYDTSKIKQYWPYGSESAPPSSTPTFLPESESQSSDRLLSIILPAVLVPVALSIGIGVALWYCCARKKGSSDDSTADESGLNIMMWMRGQGAAKQLAMSESHQKTETGTSPGTEDNLAFEPPASEKSVVIHHEMEDTQVSELCDTSSPAELRDTGFTPISPSQKQFGPYPSDNAYSPVAESPCLGQWAPFDTSPASEISGSERQWIVSPVLGTLSSFPNFSSSGGQFGGHEAGKATAEEPIREERAVSPSSEHERIGIDYITGEQVVCKLGRTISGETGDGRFRDERSSSC